MNFYFCVAFNKYYANDTTTCKKRKKKLKSKSKSPALDSCHRKEGYVLEFILPLQRSQTQL